MKQIEKLVYHRNCYKLLGKFEVAKTRHDVFQSSPGHISTRSDYAERFKCEPDGQLQSEYFDNNRTLSMEGCCLDRFTTSDNVMDYLNEGGNYIPAENDLHREFHLHLSDSKFQNAATTTQHLYEVLTKLFKDGNMMRYGTMWDQTDGCSKQYRCSIAYYLLSFLSSTFVIDIDRGIDTPGHGKDVVDGFNAVQKRYLKSCLRSRATPEVHDSSSKQMRVNAMTEEGEVSFADECKRLLLRRDEVGTRGDKKHAKRESRAKLKESIYWVHKEENLKFNDMKATYKILNNTEGLGLMQFYHIRCDPELGIGFCALRRIPCACSACVDQLSHKWEPNISVTEQPRYAIEPESCKYSSILHGYNRWYIAELHLIQKTVDESVIEYRDETILNGQTWAVADQIDSGAFGAFQTTDTSHTNGYYIVQWIGNAYTLQERHLCHAFDPPNVIEEGELVCRAKFWTTTSKGSLWYYEPPNDILVMVRLKQVLMPYFEMKNPNDPSTKLPRHLKRFTDMNPHVLCKEDHLTMMDKIEGRQNLNYEEYVEDDDEYYYNIVTDDVHNDEIT